MNLPKSHDANEISHVVAFKEMFPPNISVENHAFRSTFAWMRCPTKIFMSFWEIYM